MYVSIASRTGGRKYLSIVHGYRDENGKVRKKTIRSLGYLDELEKEYEQAKASGAANFILAEKKTNIDALKRSIKGMETLYEKNIAYKNVIAYSDFD